MTEMDWATGAEGDAMVTQMEGAPGMKYSEDPTVDRHHVIIQRYTHSIFPSGYSH